MDGANSIALVWEEILSGPFPVIARLSALSNCRSGPNSRYYHGRLSATLGHEEASRALGVVHHLFWRDWLLGSLEDQRHDLVLYVRHSGNQISELLQLWRQTQPFLAFIPDSAHEAERALFVSNILLLIGLLACEYDSPAGSLKRELQYHDDSVEFVLRTLNERYADSDLSLALLSGRLKVSTRHLGRLFTKRTGTSFRRYLRDLRITEASRLITSTSHDIKAVAGLVGYSHLSHFCHDFRECMGCVPSSLRNSGLCAGESDPAVAPSYRLLTS